MVTLIAVKIPDELLNQVAADLHGYIKVVVDIEKQILTAGGTRHVEGEQLLLQNGSLQENVWGGGLDLETNEIDYDSMINIRPSQNNPSREVLSPEVRNQMEKIIRNLLH